MSLKRFGGALLLLALAASPAFARSGFMAPAADQAPKPADGKALVVFMRPSMYGGAIASTVYEAPDSGTTFLGGVDPHQKIAVQAEPGAHRYMVVAENADFVDANLEAGKTYYVLIRPRPGVWKARFSLIPVVSRADAEFSTQKPEFAEWQASTKFVELTPAATAWYEAHKSDIEEKKAGYLEKWNRMAPADKAELTINPADGVAG